MDIVFMHETALQICAQLKTRGNEDVLLQRTTRDLRATYSACSTEIYDLELSKQVQRLVMVDFPRALPTQTLTWS